MVTGSWEAECRCCFALPKGRNTRVHRGTGTPSSFVTQRHSPSSRKAATLIPAVRRPISPLCDDDDDDDDGVRFRGVTDLSRRNPSCRMWYARGEPQTVRFFLFPLAPSRRLTAIRMPSALRRQKRPSTRLRIPRNTERNSERFAERGNLVETRDSSLIGPKKIYNKIIR